MTNKFLLGAILIATCLLTFSKNVNAQPIVDPSIFVSPYGASMGTGTIHSGLNVVHLYEAGTYFTKIISSGGDDSFTKFIVAQ